ncbi:F-box/kelch-repeat protein At1g51550 [Dendrobium catenatum]|uniref:F-box/kelch-repeat protein n=1 Tax=Dendrobium catenatum TaxID=906689 RepID=A0A2I0W2K7_9ASPA|nr:F-box/kelch-repeat protein At1g51550 [Dendrobium catenatum]PKU69892.1 F-box/kelch-repeat protein [Dendrobium catenatum]
MASSSSSSPSSSFSSTPPSYSYSSSAIHLDRDHLISILLLLPLESIISFSMTCRRFRSVASADSLWKEICRRDWGGGVVDALVASLSAQDRREYSWKRLYYRVSQAGLLSCRRLLTKDGISPRPRASHSLNFVSDCLVLFGGGCEGGRHLDDTWVAQIGNGFDRVLSWKLVDSGTPSGRFGHTCTVLGKLLVLFGGINDNGVRQNDTWVGQVTEEGSSVAKISWRLLDLEPVVPPARGAHAACCIENRQLVIHGGIGLYGLRLNDTWLLDLSESQSARWHQVMNIRPSPPARSGHSINWIGDKRIVLFGGRGSGFEVLNDLWILDIGGDNPKWKELKYDSPNLPDRPLPRVGHSATMMVGGNILIYGGEDSQRHRKDDFWMLNLGSLSRFQTTGLKKYLRRMWKKLEVEGHCPNLRSFHGACTDVSGFHLFIFGGMVDGIVHPAEPFGLRFDGELHLVELVF